MLRLLEEGRLAGYRLTAPGWWRVLESSVLKFEAEIAAQCQSEPLRQGAKPLQHNSCFPLQRNVSILSATAT